ncbi:RNA polymerase sigma factor [Nonomuraea aridisoli]|uniref:RNA polymerase sigma factor n=1 Tax=Nonomuraea aridisoli TaxID=2070368 RepID=UPI001F1B9BF8|nr:RNA polymerase sigma factor [Nonomuraea aridisoli]
MPPEHRDTIQDPEAFEAFYRRHVEAVTRFLARRVLDPQAVADLTAEVFLAVLDSAHTYRPDKGSEIAWLYGVARNTVLAEQRRSVRETRANGRIAGRRLLDGDDISRLEDRIDAESPARRALEAMATLPERDRALLELVAVDGLSPDGSINLRTFRDPDQVERDLARLGVRTDMTYLPLGVLTRWVVDTGDRWAAAEELKSEDPAVRARVRARAMNTASSKAIRPEHGITIYPRHIKPGQIVLIEVMENPVEPTVERPGVAWQFSGRLTDGPVAPCQVVDDRSAFDIGNATPPPGN